MKKDKNIATPKKIFKISILILLGILLVILIARYITEEDFRTQIDTKILKRQVEQNTLNSIEIDYESSPSILAYDKYIAVLNKNTLNIYIANGENISTLEINISNPIYHSRGKYLVLAEQSGKKIYLINGTSIVWQKEIDGEISRVNVNKNGYVSVIVTNTTYKSVIVAYHQEGKELFRTYLSATYAICTDISNNNKYLAIGEVDYSGTVIKSNVKIISMNLAQTNPDEAIINKYESESGQIINNIRYQNKNVAICMFNSYIQKVYLDEDERFVNISSDAIFLDINLEDNIAIVEKQSSGLYSYEYEMIIKSTSGVSENLFILDSNVPKDLIICGETIGINLGTEVQIINSNGLLLKSYKSTQEIKSLVIGESIAGIIFNDKIEIINL